MNTKLKFAGLMLVAGTVLTGQAQARDPAVGAVLGAGAGAVIGAAIGGHEGAAIGGIIGAVAGATMAQPRVVVGVSSVGYPAVGQYTGGYVQTHGPDDGHGGGYRDGYSNGRYDGGYGYRGNPGYGGPPAGVRYPSPVVVLPGHGYYPAAAQVIIAPPPRIIYGPPYPHYQYHHPDRQHHRQHHRHHREWRAY